MDQMDKIRPNGPNKNKVDLPSKKNNKVDRIRKNGPNKKVWTE